MHATYLYVGTIYINIRGLYQMLHLSLTFHFALKINATVAHIYLFAYAKRELSQNSKNNVSFANKTTEAEKIRRRKFLLIRT